MENGIANRGKSSGFKEPHCLYPGDLYPFTRRPMFIIIDSDNSFVFQHIPRYIFTIFSRNSGGQLQTVFRYFGQPLVILMSPQDVPTAFQGKIATHCNIYKIGTHSRIFNRFSTSWIIVYFISSLSIDSFLLCM